MVDFDWTFTKMKDSDSKILNKSPLFNIRENVEICTNTSAKVCLMRLLHQKNKKETVKHEPCATWIYTCVHDLINQKFHIH